MAGGRSSSEENGAGAKRTATTKWSEAASRCSAPSSWRTKETISRWPSPAPGSSSPSTPPSRSASAPRHMRNLTLASREALLLSTIEGVGAVDIGRIIGVSAEGSLALVETARHENAAIVSRKLMLIEDGAIVAMHLEAIVSDMGHTVTGVARTHAGAMALLAEEKPDLVLADIQLADNSSGVAAVNETLGAVGSMPGIFVTAFPERLLTGERPEPAFVITMPFSEAHIRSAVSQAMFFASTETLAA